MESLIHKTYRGPSGASSWAWTSENEWVWARLSKLTTQGQAKQMIPNRRVANESSEEGVVTPSCKNEHLK